MHNKHVLTILVLIVLAAVGMIVVPQVLDLIATLILAYVLLFGMATIGWFIIPGINALDDCIIPEKRIRERTRMIIAATLIVVVAVLQNALATFLLGHPLSPLNPFAQALGQVEVVLSSFNVWWMLWGVLTYLAVYWYRELKLT